MYSLHPCGLVNLPRGRAVIQEGTWLFSLFTCMHAVTATQLVVLPHVSAQHCVPSPQCRCSVSFHMVVLCRSAFTHPHHQLRVTHWPLFLLPILVLLHSYAGSNVGVILSLRAWVPLWAHVYVPCCWFNQHRSTSPHHLHLLHVSSFLTMLACWVWFVVCLLHPSCNSSVFRPLHPHSLQECVQSLVLAQH